MILAIITSTDNHPQPMNAHMAQGCSNKSPNMLTVESTKRNFKIFILASVLSTRSLLLLRATLALFATLSTYQIADDWSRSPSGAPHYSDDGRSAQSQLYLKLLGLLSSWHTGRFAASLKLLYQPKYSRKCWRRLSTH